KRCCQHSQAGYESRIGAPALAQPHNRFAVPPCDELGNAGHDPEVEVQGIEWIEAPDVLEALQSLVCATEVGQRQGAQSPSECRVLVERQGLIEQINGLLRVSSEKRENVAGDGECERIFPVELYGALRQNKRARPVGIGVRRPPFANTEVEPP